MLLNELLTTEKTVYDFLLEDLGNLKTIDKDFLSMLKIPYWTAGKRKDKLSKKAGENSPVDVKIFKSAKSGLESFEADKDAIVIILRDYKSEEQLLAMVKRSAKEDRTSQKFDIRLKGPGLKKIGLTPEEIKEFGKKLPSPLSVFPDKTTSDSNVSHINAYKLFTALKNLLSSRDMSIEVVVIKVDQDRLEKQQTRAKTKIGQIPLPSDAAAMKAFTNSAKIALKMRLDDFKSKKAKSVNSMEEMLRTLSEEGYLDKISIGDIPYSLSNDRINLKGLKGDKWYGDSYVEYEVNENSAAFKELKKKIREINGEVWDKKITPEEGMKRMVEAGYMPTRFKVILGLEGGKIVPKSVDFGKIENSLYI